MKYSKTRKEEKGHSRAPQGARGLKWELLKADEDGRLSRPARGAWVEMG